MMIFATNSSWELPDGSYSTSTVYVTTIIQPPNSDSDSSSSSSHKSNSAAVIGGATAGGIVALLAVTGILYWFWRKRKNWDDIFEEEEDEYTTDGGPPSHRPMSQVGTVAVQEPTAYQVCFAFSLAAWESEIDPRLFNESMVSSDDPAPAPNHLL
jgi:hypothetical protein